MLNPCAIVTAIVLLSVPAVFGGTAFAARVDEPPVFDLFSGGEDISTIAPTSVDIRTRLNIHENTNVRCTVLYGPEDEGGDAHFELSKPCGTPVNAGIADADQELDTHLDNLEPGQVYDFMFVAKSNQFPAGNESSSSQFITLALAPIPTTGSAEINSNGVLIFHGSVTPNGPVETGCRFDFGLAAGQYTNEAGCDQHGFSGDSPIAVSGSTEDFSPGDVIHYRLVAAKSDQEVNGDDHVFVVPATGSNPSGGTVNGTSGVVGGGPGGGTVGGSGGNNAPTTGQLSLPASIKVKKGKAALTVSCAGASCSGTLTLKAKVKSGHKTKTITVGHASVHVAAGKGGTVNVTLTSAAKSALRHSHRLSVSVSGAGVHKTLTLKA